MTERKIFYSTIEIFKGLDADIVMLMLGRSFSDADAAKAIYVQGSRAKHVLYIYGRE